MANILIITHGQDATMIPIQVGLEMLGHHVLRLRLSEYPSRDVQTWSISQSEQIFCGDLDALTLGSQPISSVWCRRPSLPNMETVNVNPADRDFVNRVYREYGVSTYYALRYGLRKASADAFWVNPYESVAAANSKILQLLEARRVGLSVPDTLVTNDPSKLQPFLDKHSGRVICKSFMQNHWKLDNGQSLCGITSSISHLEGITSASIRVAPSIYQPLLSKECEFRILFLGTRYFAVRMDPDALSGYDRPFTILDPSVTFSSVELPEDLVSACIRLMDSLNIVFAAFDVILTVDNEYIFLELNEAGQFLFMEEYCPELRLVDAMCHFLVHHSMETWHPNMASISLNELQSREEVREKIAEMEMPVVGRGAGSSMEKTERS